MRRHLASHAGDGASLLPCRCAAALLRRVCHANGLRCRRYHCRQRRWWRCRRRVRMCEPACVKQDNRALTNASRRCPLHAAACAQRGAARSDAARAATRWASCKGGTTFWRCAHDGHAQQRDDTPRTRSSLGAAAPPRATRAAARAGGAVAARAARVHKAQLAWRFCPSSNARGVRAAPRVAARTRARSHGCGRPVPAARTRVGPLTTPPARPARDAHLRLEPRSTTDVPDAPDFPRAPRLPAGAATRSCARGAGARRDAVRVRGCCGARGRPGHGGSARAGPAAALWRV